MSTTKKRSPVKTVLRIIATLILIAILCTTICGAVAYWYVFDYVDSSLDLDLHNLALDQTTIVYAMNKTTGAYEEIERLHSQENRIWVNYEEIPKNLKNAFIAIEDERFLNHHGVDWKRTLSAVFYYAIGQSSHGGSTITQQLIKNLTGEDDVKPERKIQEIFRALDLEEQYTKDDILECYLNTIGLGSGLNGVQTAANTYFGKDVSDLTLAECASIAGITKYPTKYNPFLNPGFNKERQEVILNKMCELGFISERERDDAKAEKLQFQKEKNKIQNQSMQSYYVDQIITDVINDLREQKGYSLEVATKLVYSGGLKIFASIDLDVQDAMDRVYKDPNSFQTFGGDVQPESAMVIIDPYSGAILGMVGGRGEKTANRTLNRATSSFRSPGSSIKPLSVFAPGFETGVLTYGSVFDDTPIMLGGKYWPKNENGRYQGTMTLQRAAELSTNTVAVKVMEILTPQTSYDFMVNNLHFTSLVERRTSSTGRIVSDIDMSPMTLGGLTDGVSVKEMTAAYVPIVNSGLYVKPYTYTEVLDYSDKVMLENKPDFSIAMSEESAFLTRKLLENVVNSGTGTGARLKSGTQVAGKTGTTDNKHDRWFVGLTPYYVGAVWFGYDEPQRIVGATVNPSMRAWKLVMDILHEDLEKKSFPAAPGTIVTATFCKDSGMLLSDACAHDPRGSRAETGYYVKGTVPTEECTVHTIVEICNDSFLPFGIFCPEEAKGQRTYLNIERDLEGVSVEDSEYLLSNIYGIGAIPGETEPILTCDVHTTEPEPEEPEEPEDPEGTDPTDPGTWNPPWPTFPPVDGNGDTTEPTQPDVTTQPTEPEEEVPPLDHTAPGFRG